MTLRTAALIAGAVGLILLAVGFVANAVKPSTDVTPAAAVSAEVLVIPPEVLALAPDGVVTVSGSGELVARTGRTVDVDAWGASRTSVTVTGFADWETLSTTLQEPRVVPSPTPSPSPEPSGSANPSASASPSPSATPSATPQATASAEPTPQASAAAEGSQDIWRASTEPAATYTVAVANVPAGLPIVVEAMGTGNVTQAQISTTREVDDAWISQVLAWGVALSAVGLVALLLLLVDIRPAQSKGEAWVAGRTAIGTGKEPPKPGSRRARRQAGQAMPVAQLPPPDADVETEVKP